MSDDLDPRWTDALRLHSQLTQADRPAWDAIRERAEGSVELPGTNGSSTSGRHRVLALAAAMAVVIAAAGAIALTSRDRSQPVRSTDRTSAPPSTIEPVQRFEISSTVIESPGHGPAICVSGINIGFDPPQCASVPLVGWDWAQVDGEESSGDSRLGTYSAVGTFDGERLTLTQPPTAPVPLKRESDSPGVSVSNSQPCPTPPGGWEVTDRTKLDVGALERAAKAEPDFAAFWTLGFPTPLDPADPSGRSAESVEAVEAESIANVAFTGDVARHEADLRAIWGGKLCVIALPNTDDELDAAIDAVHQDSDSGTIPGIRILDRGIDTVGNQIELHVVVAPEGFEADLEERYGVSFRVTTALHPID